MLKTLCQWEGAIEIDGTNYSAIPSDFKFGPNMVITLHTKEKLSAGQAANVSAVEYRVSVRQYMTMPATPDFDFMKKWNNDVPMPLRHMVGTIEKETSGMYYMNLRADTDFNTVRTCMKCGKPITNPVSQFSGMGPECGGHNYVNPFETEEELKQEIDFYKREHLGKISWKGWVIKSAITSMEDIK